MDINQLSSLVRSLVLDSDEVVVPGLGTFRAEVVPASFSDRGFTVNPPYRKLTFVEETGEILNDSDVAIPSGVEESPAAVVQAEGLAEFVEELKKELKETRCVEFPGLGKLRLTKGNQYFFVADEDANIYPEGFGLEPVSLKNKEGDARSESGKKSGATRGKKSGTTRNGSSRQGLRLPKWVIIALIVAVVLVLAIVALRLLGTYAPDFIDRLLYSPEELAKLKGAL
ncbi:MAG: hypothetical protein J5748_01250 [Bacteroidales bacterium]|nr:hypothetical protein [Bacteroidales bacterium]